MPNSRFSPLYTTLLICWAGGLVALYFSVTNFMAEQPASTDLYKFHLSAKSLLTDKTPYWPSPQHDNPESHCYRPADALVHSNQAPPLDTHQGNQQCLHPNLNPPAFIVITSVFGWLDFVPSFWAWNVLSLLAGIGGMLVLINEHCGSLKWRTSLVATCSLLSWYPALVNIEYGQVGLWLFLLLTLAWRDLRHGRNLRAGFILGATAGIKLFVGLFILALIAGRNWKAAVSFMAGGIAVTLPGLAVMGISGHLEYLAALREVNWYASNWNASLAGLFHRIFGGASTQGFFDLPFFSALLTHTLSIVILATVFIYIKNQDKNRSATAMADTVFCLIPVTMLLLSPLGWIYYFPALTITLSIYLKNAGVPSLKSSLLPGTLMIITIFPFTIRSTDRFSTLADWWWTGAIYSYALIIFFIMALLTVRKINTTA